MGMSVGGHLINRTSNEDNSEEAENNRLTDKRNYSTVNKKRPVFKIKLINLKKGT